MARIYVASSWRNDTQPFVVLYLRAKGHEVYDFRNPPKKIGFAWSEIDPDWENWTTGEYIESLDHPLAVEGFESDMGAMDWADACVLVLPAGRSANTEAGWMRGAGKFTAVYIPEKQEPELMYRMHDVISDSLPFIESRISKHFK